VRWDVGGAFATAGVTVSDGVVSAAQALAAGVYTVTLQVTDDDGGTDSETAPGYVVVYDATGGFVTGGGWINSGAGDCTLTAACGAAAGKASFGFVSKYLPGARKPSGNTEFEFRAGNFRFESASYDWLVVAGARAQYKGEGTVNGGGAVYGFLLTAVDGAVNGGGGTDRFRIKIWDRATGDVVYDNQRGQSDDSDAGTALGGGSIVIHK
jgi:PKD repeat protein